MRGLPRPKSELAAFGQILEPTVATQPILARAVREAALEWLIEISEADALKAVKLKPRSRALFVGPPGTGKTTLAHHLAARIGLRMLAVQPERIIDCWVGSNSRNLSALFKAVGEEEEPLVLFFDEFDSLAAKRIPGGSGGHGAAEHYNEMVNTLLQRIEAHDGYIIAATNDAKGLDPAIWRRFDIHIELGLPGQEERRHILARYLKPYILSPRDLDRLAASFDTASPALMRQFAEGLKRNLVVGPKVGWNLGKVATIDRLLAAIQPHPDLGKPRLWNLGATKDEAIRELAWPLTTTKKGAADEPDEENNVVPLRGAMP